MLLFKTLILRILAHIFLLFAGCLGISSSQANQKMDTLLQDVQQNQFEDTYQVLLAGEQQVVVSVNDSTTAISRGIAIIISEAGKGAFDQHGLAALTEDLNSVGWATVLMPAPDTGFSLPEELPEQVAAQQTDPVQANLPSDSISKSGLIRIHPKAFTQQEQILKSQMQAVVSTFSPQYPGFVLVIAQGTSAAWLTKIYAEEQLDPPDAMVAISPYWPQRDYNIQLPKWLSETPMPYLDVFTPWDSKWAQETVKQRKVQTLKSLKLVYRQRQLIGQSFNQEQYAFLAKEIYGWLTFMGW